MITGGVKFFDQNFVLSAFGGTIVDTLGTSLTTAASAIDKNRQTYLRTVGSTDLTVETFTLTFPSATFNRIILVDHNWKQYTVKYWNGASFVNFTSVVGLDGSLGSGISETVFADNSSYYEVASVTTTQIQITVTKTQTVDAQKYIGQIMATLELGTLQGFPKVSGSTIGRSIRQMEMLSGRAKMVKGLERFSIALDFSEYATATTYTPDLDLMYTLADRDTPFVIWPCGGRRGRNYYRYAPRGMRLQDIYLVQLATDIEGTFPQDIFTSTVGLGVLEFPEHV
jgi:hypothetical protein